MIKINRSVYLVPPEYSNEEINLIILFLYPSFFSFLIDFKELNISRILFLLLSSIEFKNLWERIKIFGLIIFLVLGAVKPLFFGLFLEKNENMNQYK